MRGDLPFPPLHFFLPFTTDPFGNMSLADEFLDDLNYEDPEAAVSPQEEPSISTQFPASSASKKRKGDDLAKEEEGGGDMDTGDVENEDGDNDGDDDDFDADMEETEADRALAAMMRDVQNAKNARDIAKLMDSAEMQGILKVNPTFSKGHNVVVMDLLLLDVIEYSAYLLTSLLGANVRTLHITGPRQRQKEQKCRGWSKMIQNTSLLSKPTQSLLPSITKSLLSTR